MAIEQANKRKADETLQRFLDKRKQEDSLRALKQTSHLIDLCSNDYLGLSRDPAFHKAVSEEIYALNNNWSGATGSRLITGNSQIAEELEQTIAIFHDTENALLFNSGYDANVGFFSSVPQRNDLILYDDLIHASVRDGLKMARARSIPFNHNNLDDVREKLAADVDNIYIALESVYSMDGDFAPLEELTKLTLEDDRIHLIVDEAHATGVYGDRGEGRVGELGLEELVYARIHTFGKGLGAHGAAVVGSNILKQFLLNYARSFIFTTSLPLHSLVSIKIAYETIPTLQDRRERIQSLIDLFRSSIEEGEQLWLLRSPSPIQSVIIPGNTKARELSAKLEDAGYYVKAILYPTVPRGLERLRICIHAFNTEEEIREVTDIINRSVT